MSDRGYINPLLLFILGLVLGYIIFGRRRTTLFERDEQGRITSIIET